MRQNPASLNLLFILSVILTMLCGYGFVFWSAGFVATVLNSGDIVMCSQMGSSSPDDNITPMVAILFLPSMLARIFRFAQSVSLIEVIYFFVASGFSYWVVVAIRGCADFLPTIFVTENLWLASLCVGFATSNIAMLLLLYKRMK